jgi:hypothetical protein
MTTILLHSAASLHGGAAKPSRIPELTITFVQAALTTAAAANLDPRDRQFLTHVVANPQLTLQELASYAGIRTRQGAHKIWKAGLRTLWRASPPELEARYPIAELTGRKHGRYGKRGPHSLKTRAKLRVAQLGRKISHETRERYRQAQIGKRHSAKTRAQMTASQLRRWKLRKQRLAA